MGKIIAELSPGQSAGHDPWAWGSKCRPRRAGITGREVPWEPKNGAVSKKLYMSADTPVRGQGCPQTGVSADRGVCRKVFVENKYQLIVIRIKIIYYLSIISMLSYFVRSREK